MAGKMKRYLLLIIILALTLGTLVGCGRNESTAKIIAYLNEEQPINKRHMETLTAISKAIETITMEAEKHNPDDPSKTQLESIALPKPSAPNTVGKITVEGIVRSLTRPKTPPEPIIPSGLREALTSGINTLDLAIKQIDSEIIDYNKLIPPPEAMTYNGLIVAILLKELAINNDILSNYRSLLSNGYSDVVALDRVQKGNTERGRLWWLYKYELDELLKKAGK